MKTVSDIVMKLLGVLLLTAAILKGRQLLTIAEGNAYKKLHAATQTFTKRLIVFFQAGLFNKVRYEITKEVVSG